MWSDNDIDNAFQRLNPSKPEPTPFPLDAWLRLETQLDEAVIERAVRRRVWRLFAVEVSVIALAALVWLLWPSSPAVPANVAATTKTAAATSTTVPATRPTGPVWVVTPGTTVSASAPATLAIPAIAPTTVESPATASSTSGSNNQVVNQDKQLVPSTSVALAPNAPQLLAIVTPTSRDKHAPASRHTTDERAYHTTEATHPTTKVAGAAALAVSASRKPSRRATGEATYRKAAYSTRQGAGSATMLAATTSRKAKRARYQAARRTYSEPNIAASSANEAANLGRRNSQAAQIIKPTSNPATIPAEALAKAPSPEAADDAPAKSPAAAEDLTALALRPVAPPLAPRPELPAPLATVPGPPQPEKPTPAQQPRFYIGLVGAPDVSTVKFVNVQRPLINAGLILEYRLGQRFRVSTGLLRGNKKYYARREDYAFPPAAYTRDFSRVDGSCTILDVPLNLRYDALVRPNARLFGTVGVSSFFMQHERYTYDYVDNNMTYTWESSFSNENRHLFSILNLSFGYERSLSNHWSLQAEPYLKLPLAGVGAGKVKLTSAGVFLGMKYGF